MTPKKSGYELFTMLLFSFAGIFYRLFVTTKVWHIILGPYGVPDIGLKAAWGMGILWAVISQDYNQSVTKDNENSLWLKMGMNFGGVSMAWLLAHWFFT